MATTVQSITEGTRIRMLYRSATTNEITERCVDVEKVYRCGNGHMLVVGYCHRRMATRTFNAAAILWWQETESVATATFGMHAAVSNQDAQAFTAAYNEMRAA